MIIIDSYNRKKLNQKEAPRTIVSRTCKKLREQNHCCTSGNDSLPGGAKKSHRNLGLLVASGDVRLFADSKVNQRPVEEILEKVRLVGTVQRGGVRGGAFADLLSFPLMDGIQTRLAEKTRGRSVVPAATAGKHSSLERRRGRW